MSEHLPECPILKPCRDDKKNPEHGFCGNGVGRCLHCYAECICDALRACVKRVTAYERSWENAVIIARAGYKDGYTAAINDARNETALSLFAIDTYLPPDDHNHVLAVIDALRVDDE